MSKYWGYHLILDCKSCNIDKIINEETINRFVEHLVNEIDMKSYGEPIIKHFATHNEAVAGYSLVQLIETSAITGHFVDLTGDAYLDIFSCKEFNIDLVQNIVRLYFNPKQIKVTYLTRQA